MSFIRLIAFVIATCCSFLAAWNVGFLLANPSRQFSVYQIAATALAFVMIATVSTLKMRRELNLILLGGLLVLDVLTVGGGYFGAKYLESILLFSLLGSVIAAMYFAVKLLDRREAVAQRFIRSRTV